MTWGKGLGEPVGGAPTSWREGLHAVIADVWDVCNGQEKAPKSYTGCHTPPSSASSPRVLLRARFCPSNAPSNSLPNPYCWKL